MLMNKQAYANHLPMIWNPWVCTSKVLQNCMAAKTDAKKIKNE